MSIASEITRLQGAKASLKTSIEAKGVTVPAATTLDGYPALVDQISQGGGTVVEEKNVNFYDYDGELVYSYSKADFLALNEMPANPTHEGFTAQGWNWTLSDAKTYVTSYDYLNIGQHYVTSDGKTRVWVHLDDSDYLFCQASWDQSAANGVSINWGDESESETVAGTGQKQLFHLYQNTGDYMVEYTVLNGTVRFGGNTDTYRIFGPAVSNVNNAYEKISISKIELGSCNGFHSNCFRTCQELKLLNIPSTAGTWDSPCQYIFASCHKLLCVVIPNGVTYLGTSAFQDMHDLKAICVPNSITQLQGGAFRSLNSIKTLTLPPGILVNNTYVVGEDRQLKRLIMPDAKVTSAAITYSFYNNISAEVLPLLKIDGESNVTTIPAYTYANCNSLKEFTIPSTVTTIGNAAFSGCFQIKEITIPQNVTVINQDVFASMYSLSKIDIPSGVTSIGNSAFRYDTNLSRVNISSITPPTLGNTYAFQNCSSSLMIVVPGSSIESYRSATNWTAFKANLVGYLDTEPTQVDYISSDGTAFINTLFPVVYIGKVISEMRYTDTNRLVAGGDGVYNVNSQYALLGPANITAQDRYAVQWGTSTTVNLGVVNDGDWHTVEMDVLNRSAKIDNNSPVEVNTTVVKSNNVFGVFNRVGYNSSRRASDRRRIKIWDIHGNLVRDMIPVKINGSAYMYDRVNKLLFANANSTGTLSYTDF